MLRRRSLLFREQEQAAQPGYDVDAAAYFARMAVQESAEFKTAVNTFVINCKADGVWELLDRFYLGATNQVSNSLYCLRNAGKSFSYQGSGTFTPDKGWAGDGSTGYIDFGEVPNAAGNQYALDSASFGVYCNGSPETGTGNFWHLGMNGNGRVRLTARVSGQQEGGRVNSSSDDTNIRVSTTRTGLRSASRVNNTNAKYFYGGALSADVAKASASPVSALNITLLRNDTSYCPDQIAAGFSGGGMTEAQMADLCSHITTLLTALGAN